MLDDDLNENELGQNDWKDPRLVRPSQDIEEERGSQESDATTRLVGGGVRIQRRGGEMVGASIKGAVRFGGQILTKKQLRGSAAYKALDKKERKAIDQQLKQGVQLTEKERSNLLTEDGEFKKGSDKNLDAVADSLNRATAKDELVERMKQKVTEFQAATAPALDGSGKSVAEKLKEALDKANDGALEDAVPVLTMGEVMSAIEEALNQLAASISATALPALPADGDWVLVGNNAGQLEWMDYLDFVDELELDWEAAQ